MIDIFRTLHPVVAENIFLSSSRGMFTSIFQSWTIKFYFSKFLSQATFEFPQSSQKRPLQMIVQVVSSQGPVFYVINISPVFWISTALPLHPFLHDSDLLKVLPCCPTEWSIFWICLIFCFINKCISHIFFVNWKL